MSGLPNLNAVDQALRDLGATGGAPELHGGLCGLVCALGPAAPAAWVADLAPDPAPPEAPADAAGEVLRAVATATCQALTEGDMTFTPLLPGDEASLDSRTRALAAWCSGFMHGLGQGTAQAPVDLLGNEVTREVLADFSEIARADADADDAEAEAAYMELVEFVRVSVQLVFEELYPLRRQAAKAALH